MKKDTPSRCISYRQAESTTLRDGEDTGYVFYCTACTEKDARYGGPVFGPRIINIKLCNYHQEKKGKKHEDLERINENYWKIDPPKERFRRSNVAMERSRQKAAERLLEKQGRGSFIGPCGSKIII